MKAYVALLTALDCMSVADSNRVDKDCRVSVANDIPTLQFACDVKRSLHSSRWTIA